MYELTFLFVKFILFSMVGYIFETTMCAIIDRKWTNRGFLCGPIIPIYGVGSIILVFLLNDFKDNIFLLFLFGIVITSTIEYLTGFTLEKIFHNKWWDYSGEKYNLNGYVCLKNSLCFGLGTPIVVCVLNPLFNTFLFDIKDPVLYGIGFILLIIFIFDVSYSVVVAYNLRNRLIIVEKLKNDKLMKIPGVLEKAIKKRLGKIHKYPKRLLNSFPNLLKSNEKEFALMKKISLTEKNKRKEAKQKKKNNIKKTK